VHDFSTISILKCCTHSRSQLGVTFNAHSKCACNRGYSTLTHMMHHSFRSRMHLNRGKSPVWDHVIFRMIPRDPGRDPYRRRRIRRSVSEICSSISSSVEQMGGQQRKDLCDLCASEGDEKRVCRHPSAISAECLISCTASKSGPKNFWSSIMQIFFCQCLLDMMHCLH
jgi:hypothetical protein